MKGERRKDGSGLTLSLLPVTDWLFVVLGLGASLAMLHFWGIEADGVTVLFVALTSIGSVGVLDGFRRWLQIEVLLPPGYGRISYFPTVMSERARVESVSLLLPRVQLVTFASLATFAGGVLWLVRSGETRSAVTLWLAVVIACALLRFFMTVREADIPGGEFVDGVFVFVFPMVLLASMMRSVEPARLTLTAFSITNVFFYLIFRFTVTMAAVDGQLTFQSGTFVTMIRRQRFHAVGFFAAMAYLALIIFHRMGVHWRLIAPLLLTLPLTATLIVILEKLSNGDVYRRRLICGLALALTVFALYLQIVTGRFFA